MSTYKVISKALVMKSFSLDGLLLLTVCRDSFVMLHVQMGFYKENGICSSLCSFLTIITLTTIFRLKMARTTTDKRNDRPENNSCRYIVA